MTTMSAKVNLRPCIATVVITLLATVFVMAVYLNGPLEGNFNHFFMPAEKFGVPAELRNHGITDLYKGERQTGWDGQFYYYIANDLLAQKDTAQHLDSVAYRYQRIGLPLLAKLAATITGRSWVSPLTYYLTSLLIVLIATGFAAIFFQRRHLSPYLILLWSLACGTQVTQLNGLPDAAADGLLIIALVSLVNQRRWLYMTAAALAALSREVYVLLPGFMLLTSLINQTLEKKQTHADLKNSTRAVKLASAAPAATLHDGTCQREKHDSFFDYKQKLYVFVPHLNKATISANLGKMANLAKAYLPHIFPVALAISWQIFLRVKFNAFSSSQAPDVLGQPLASALHYLVLGISGNHPVVGMGKMAYIEGLGICLFLFLLTINAVKLIALFIKALQPSVIGYDKRLYSGIACAFIAIISVYLCFGPIVMMHHTGYFKAANIFLFVLPYAAALSQVKLSRPTILFLIFITLYFDFFLWDRINAPPYHADASSPKYAATPPACLNDYRVDITPLTKEFPAQNHLITNFLQQNNRVIRVSVSNLSKQPFSPFRGKGGVNMSYQWLDAGTLKLVKDGQRTELAATLAPGQTATLPVYINFPKIPGNYLLKLSLVQEGCNWFYMVDPSSGFTLPYKITW